MPPSHCAGYGFRGSDGRGEGNGSAACRKNDRGAENGTIERNQCASDCGAARCQIIELAKPGTLMHTGDVVLEFDPSSRNTTSSRTAAICSKRNKKLRKQERTRRCRRGRQDCALESEIRGAQAELEVSKNEIVSPIDAQKNLLGLDEAKRALAQLELDISSHSASNKAALAISEEKTAQGATGDGPGGTEHQEHAHHVAESTDCGDSREPRFDRRILFWRMTLPDYPWEIR